MNKRAASIDVAKLALYLLKCSWLIVLCVVIGFAGMFYYAEKKAVDMYTASGTMYVNNANPNMVNYQYASSSDLNSAVKLADTYMVVVRSNKVMDVVAERLAPTYPGITSAYIAATISMSTVSDTGVTQVSCRTRNPQMSADIVNAVLDVAPAEIIRVVSAGNIEIIDYATAPTVPDGRSPRRQGMVGALGGGLIAAAFLLLLFLLNQKVDSAKELEERYTPPVLSSVKRDKREDEDPGKFVLTPQSPMDLVESYAKLRMNLLFTLVGKDSRSVAVTSAISGEGKSTISASLAVSVAMSGKKVLLVDADLRRACQRDLFQYGHRAGLTEALIGSCAWQDVVLKTDMDNLFILPAGRTPPNPAELLESPRMKDLLKEMEAEYELVLLDAPPINIVSDPLALSAIVAGSVFVVRQKFSDHREIKKALIASEMTGMNILGFVFYGENIHSGGYYSRRYYNRYYKNYYHKYDPRNQQPEAMTSDAESPSGNRAEEVQP